MRSFAQRSVANCRSLTSNIGFNSSVILLLLLPPAFAPAGARGEGFVLLLPLRNPFLNKFSSLFAHGCSRLSASNLESSPHIGTQKNSDENIVGFIGGFFGHFKGITYPTIVPCESPIFKDPLAQLVPCVL